MLCAIDIFSKCAWVISLNNKNGITINNAFQKILHESNRKPDKIWVDTGSEFYNRSMKSWLQKEAMKMYSTHNEGKSVIGKRFIKTLKFKIYKYMTSMSRNVDIHKLDDIVNKYNDKCHRAIKMKPNYIKSNAHTNSSKEINDRDPKFSHW